MIFNIYIYIHILVCYKVIEMKIQFVVFLFIVVFDIFFALIAARTSDELRITLPNGSKLVGRTFRSHDGKPIKAFLRVPYAKPPLHHLRLKVNFIDIFLHLKQIGTFYIASINWHLLSLWVIHYPFLFEDEFLTGKIQ